ncbi:GH3 auxin-responsive promoter family protein [Taibaiella sp. KBW10]|uniref:GH3 auxin-responsive promoter family protein n=1 Tax=Taibaiella sp. KBW10 TaxID=2153357 RepID=UPI001F3B4794|nr:GH3 auxin-responsive promoter family protein [Taibaiella sp. KBW10]
MRLNAVDNFMLNPIDTQKKVFNDLIGSAQFTDFGKQYSFDTINAIREFKERVPVQEYDDVKPYIQRILDGEQNVLWNTPISWFAKSSGTTSDKSKFIPVSKETLDDTHYRSGKDLLGMYVRMYPDTDLFGGKCLTIGGSHQVNQMNADCFYGDLSAVMLQNMPLIGQVMRSPDLKVALMDEWEHKIETIIDSTLDENITYIAGVPTWTLVLLKRILEKTGKTDIREVWPNLELYIHGGVSFKPYQNQFKQLIPHEDMHYLETYNASEGFFAAQDTPEHENGMLLFLNHGIFFEFMPMEEYGKAHPDTLNLREVALNTNYALIISTNSGLWRYIVGDTIQFTSLEPFRIKVTGRIKHFINAFGEEVIIDNSDYAIEQACAQTGAIVNDYTAAPVYMTGNSNGAHEWIIEFENLPVPLPVFVEAMDLALQSVNSDYEAKRHKDIALRMPIVHDVAKGSFNAWLKSKGKLGGQNKVPRLANERKFVEEILTFLNQQQ